MCLRSTENDQRPDARFRVGVLAAVALGAAVRLTCVFTDGRPFVGGDGFSYSVEALRLADGLGYTSGWGDVGQPIAHHPPAWVTLLGLVSALGGRSLRAHQLTTVVVGLALIAVAGAVGRRYAGNRSGILAAFAAALYPGFWVVEANVLSEPLGLVLIGIFMLLVANLRDDPTLHRCLGVGAVCGLLALVRSEQSALLAIVVAPVLFRVPGLAPSQRISWLVGAVLAFVTVISPWTIYNSRRFAQPVILSTNSGPALLAGNCPPWTYGGEFLGYFYNGMAFDGCGWGEAKGLDRSEQSPICIRAALHNMSAHLDRLPLVIAARLGRTVGVYRPTQTVQLTASWMGMGLSPIWAWVTSYLLLIPFALAGTVCLYRSNGFLLPLLGSVFVAFLVVSTFFGEPRMHTPSDLATVVLAAAGLNGLLRSRACDPPSP
ncbi:MAG TPA: glycosyltransferase family 39 protein [Candidatus Limnocylindrales bacterium]|nr:glycosyltransferase family 39 protein [Candidatus Limnocylindrales bacterium]